MAKKVTMNETELKEVSGGAAGDGIKKRIDSEGYVDRTCQICGKTFQYSKFLLNDWNGIDLDGRHDYAINTCPECKKEHPFKSRVDWVKNK